MAATAAPLANVDPCSWAVISTGCDAGNKVKDVVGGGVDVVKGGSKAVKESISFASDPLGYLAEKAQSGAEGLVETVLPALNKALEPNLSADWFISTYRFTFAVAMLVWILQLIGLFVSVARNKISNEEFIDTLVPRSAAFIVGCMFGPMVGALLIELVGALTDVVINSFLGTSTKEIYKGLQKLISDGNPAEMVGGQMVALIVFVGLIMALLVIVVTVMVLMVTLYLSGVVFPLGWQWITSAKRSDRAMKIVRVWVGVLLSQPLIYLMLGSAIALASSTTLQQELPGSTDSPKALRQFIGVLVALIAMWMAALSPMLLAKFAPIMPTDGGGGGGFKLGGRGGGSSSGMNGGGGLAERSGSSTTPSLDVGAGGGDGGGSSLMAAMAPAGASSGSQSAAGASKGGGAAGGAAGSSAATDAEAAGALGAETGPGDAVIMAGAAAAGAAKDAMDEAGAEAEQTASDASSSAASSSSPSTGGSDGGSAGGGSIGGHSTSDGGSSDTSGSPLSTSGEPTNVDAGGSSLPGSDEWARGDRSGDLDSGGGSGGGVGSSIGSLMDDLAEQSYEGMSHQDAPRDEEG